MAHPLMPKATAVWLVENTALTFRQIAQFCGLHELEVQGIADGEVVGGFHIFESRQAADVYLGSEMVAGLTSNPAFSGFEISHYEVLEELSRITGSPSGALARAG